MVVYLEHITGSYATAMLMLGVTSITTSIMEIPTGIFSDKIGRRKTMILSGLSFLLTAFLYAIAGSYESIPILVVASFIMGVSDAFLSGTDEALMYETAHEMGQPEKFDIIYAKAGFWIQIGLIGAAIIGACITFFYDLITLAWVSAFIMIPYACVGFLYIEPMRTKKQKKTASLRHLRKALRELWKNKRLRFYALINILDSSILQSSNRFESAYFASLVPLWLVNIARLVKQICGAISFAIVPKIKKFGSVKIFFISEITGTLIRFAGALINNFFTPFIMSSHNLFYGTKITASSDILHQEFTNNQRATMKSIISFASNIIIAITMYLLGVLADYTSPWAAIMFGIIAKIVIIIISLNILRIKNRKKK